MSGATLALSTSSPQASVALISEKGELLWSDEQLAPANASGAIPKLVEAGLAATGLTLGQISAFAVDLGPGSFTGVRVGIVFAKVLAFASGVKIRGATSFDLIAPNEVAFVPSRRGEVFVRTPGEAPLKMQTPPSGSVGYEYGSAGHFPHARGFAALLAALPLLDPVEVVPAYFAEPSISLPKRPYAEQRG